MRDAKGGRARKFFYAAEVDPGKARVVARLADGTPLLIDKQVGEGHVLVFASGFDNVTNDLPLNPAFVAFVDQTARYLSGEESMRGARVVDSYRAAAESGEHGGDQGECRAYGGHCRAGRKAAADSEGGGGGVVVPAGTCRVLPGSVCKWAGCADCGESGPRVSRTWRRFRRTC